MAENKGKKKVTPYDRAINYLSQVEGIDMMIKEKQDLIDSLRASVTGSAINTEGDHVQTSPKDKLGETCTKIVDLCEEINADIDYFVEVKAGVMRTIDQYVDNLKARRLLYIRYFKYQAIPSAAKELKVSGRTAYRLHNEAVRKISKKFQNGTQRHKLAHKST